MNLTEEIKRLKEEKDAVILAHYYTRPEIQEIADHVGDSYYLSKMGREADEKTIVFCGVRFMAESAKLLSKEKRVLFANQLATCGMARRVDMDKVDDLLNEHEDGVLVSYINCSTELKSISHTCCTSSSAEKIIGNMQSDKIIFVPDKNLGGYISEKFPEKEFVLFDGCCCIHDDLTIEEVRKAKSKHKDALVLAHPECRKDVRGIADYVGSTSGIIDFATESENQEFIIATDIGIFHELEKRNPKKKFYGLDMNCANMKLTSLEDVYSCLLKGANEIVIGEELLKEASKALETMHKLAE